MKKSRFSEEQVIRILAEANKSDKSIKEVCRDNGITDQTFYRWRRQYGELTVSEVQENRRLTQENARLKKLVAERDLEIEALKEVMKKKW